MMVGSIFVGRIACVVAIVVIKDRHELNEWRAIVSANNNHVLHEASARMPVMCTAIQILGSGTPG